MKKIIIFSFIMILCISLIACGDSKKDGGEAESTDTEETTSETLEDASNGSLPEGINPDDYYSFVQFELPEDFRQAAVDFMRKQASIEWTPGKTFTIGKQNEHWGFSLTYEAGKEYHGLLYTTMKTSIEEFQMELDKNGGKFTGTNTDYNYVMGVECNTSINHSLQQFTNAVTGKAETLMPSYADKFGGVIVGNYTVPDGARQTAKIIAANSPEDIYAAYAELDVGDIIITKNEDTRVNHLRMVTEKPTVATTAAGKINPSRSYIVTIEQTDTFDSTRKDGVKTTWWIDHQYSFSKLYETNYVPVSVEAYDTGKGIVPYIALDEEITPELLAKGTFTGTVSSDYPIRFLHVDLYNAEGKLVSQVVENAEYDVRKYNLRKYAYNIYTDDVTAGDYTFVVTAGISSGSAELLRVNFTYNDK